jgi:hypothetical protein
MYLRQLIILAFALIATGCANFASFQSADTVPEGEGVLGVGASYTAYEIDIGDEPTSATVPAVNIWYRRGITDEFELHTNVWLPFGATIGAKYQLLGERKTPGFGFSLGADIGYLSISTGSGDTEASTSLLDIYVPVYTGYRVSESFAVYLTPKYIMRAAFGSASSGDEEASSTEIFHIPAATLGVALGSSVEFLVEGTVGYDTVTEALVYTAGIGVGF